MRIPSRHIRPFTWGSDRSVLLRALVVLVAMPWFGLAFPGASPTEVAAESASVVVHDCLLAFRFGTDLRYGVTLRGAEARAVNDAGEVVGWSEAANGAIHAVLWTKAATRDLGTLGGANSCALGINASGQVVGWAETATGERHAVRWDEGDPTDLGMFPGESSVAFAINDAGQEVGLAWPVDTRLTAPVGRAVLWEGRGMTDIGALLDQWGSGAQGINERGEIVGWVVTHDGDRLGFVWSPAGFALLEVRDSSCSSASGINDAGEIAGWADDANVDGARHAILWSDGVPVDLGGIMPGETAPGWAIAHDVNTQGSIVGALDNGGDGLVAVIWPKAGVAARELGSLGGTNSEAYAINDTGQVVGWSLTRDGEPRAFSWQDGVMTELPVPPIDAGA
jgi:probable HAF family extracellular repeat protein